MINVIPALGTILEIAGKVATTAAAAKSIVDTIDNNTPTTVNNVQPKQQPVETVKNVEVIERVQPIQQSQPSPINVNLNVYVGDRGLSVSSDDENLIWLVKRR